MFTVTKSAPDRVDIALSGSLDAAEMGKALDNLIDASEDIVHGRMLYTITDFSMPSMAAIGVEFARLPKLFGLVGKFDRCAVLCDAAWIRTAAAVEGALIPGLKIKAFEMSQLADAEGWLAIDTA